MIYAAVYDAEGRLGQVSGAMDLGDAVLSLLPWFDEGGIDWIEVPDTLAPLTLFVGAGGLQIRPDTGLPPAHTMAPGDWVLPDVPVGTAVLIDGVQVLISNEDGLVLRRAARGTCTIELVPPFPFIGATCQLTVTG